MTNEELEAEYDALKDKVHDLENENLILKRRISVPNYSNIYIKKEDVNKWIGKYFPKQDLISIDDLISCIEDLDSDVEHLKEKYEDLEQDLEDNYRPIPVSEQVGISDRDFI